MKRTVPALAILAVLAMGLGGCGEPKEAKARSDAKAACVEIISLGATIAEHTSVLSSQAYGALVYAHLKANDAVSLDPRWDNLAGAVRAIGASFVSGQRQTLRADIDDMVVACQPVVGSAAA